MPGAAAGLHKSTSAKARTHCVSATTYQKLAIRPGGHEVCVSVRSARGQDENGAYRMHVS